jgi:hypothetical protein
MLTNQSYVVAFFLLHCLHLLFRKPGLTKKKNLFAHDPRVFRMTKRRLALQNPLSLVAHPRLRGSALHESDF